MKDLILFEDKALIVVVKPAGVPSQSDKTGDFDMVSRLKNYIFQQNPNKGEPYIGVIHRLDRPVGGVMVFAKTQDAAKKLSTSVQNRSMKKKYLTVLNGDFSAQLHKEPMKLTDYLVKDGRTNCSKVTKSTDPNGKKAELYYQVKQVKDDLSLVEVELLTGRHHQIRVQMVNHLGGIWGDTKYNEAFQDKPGWSQIALYAYHLEFPHPISGKLMKFESIPNQNPFEIFTFQSK